MGIPHDSGALTGIDRARARDNSRDEGAVVRRMRDPNGVRGPVYGYAEMRAAILRNWPPGECIVVGE